MNRYVRHASIVAATLVVNSIANAATIGVFFSGSTVEGSVGGDLDYAPGETFSGWFVFDTYLSSDISPDPLVGTFQDNQNFSTVSGMLQFEFATSEGGYLLFDRFNVDRPLGAGTAYTLAGQGRVTGLSGAVVSTQSFQIRDLLGGLVPGNDPIIGGSVQGLSATIISLDLSTSTQGANPRSLFDDPNLLLSGAGRRFALDDEEIDNEFAVGRLTIGFANGQDTTLVVSEIQYAPIPVPGALWLFASALLLLVNVRRVAI